MAKFLSKYRLLGILALGYALFSSQLTLLLYAAETTFDKHFPLPKHLTIEGSFLEVRIEGEDRRDIQVKGVIEEVGPDSSYEWLVDQIGEELKIRVAAKSSPNYNVEGKIIVRIPKGLEVKVANSSGNIWVSHLEAQDINLRSASGDITLQNCQGKFKVVAASGEINASNLQGTIRLKTVSGDLHLQHLKGLMACRTTSGQIEASELTGDIEIEASCGAVALESINGDLDIDTKSGAIKVRALQVTEEASLRSITGSIYLETASKLEDHSLQLTSETGSINRKGQNLGRKWRLESGNKMIKVVTTSGSIHLNN